MRELNPFQERSRQRLRTLLASRDIEAHEDWGGILDVYLRVFFVYEGKEFEVFLFDDEIGYLIDREWKISDTPDVASASALMDSFLHELASQLDDLVEEVPEPSRRQVVRGRWILWFASVGLMVLLLGVGRSSAAELGSPGLTELWLGAVMALGVAGVVILASSLLIRLGLVREDDLRAYTFVLSFLVIAYIQIAPGLGVRLVRFFSGSDVSQPWVGVVMFSVLGVGQCLGATVRLIQLTLREARSNEIGRP